MVLRAGEKPDHPAGTTVESAAVPEENSGTQLGQYGAGLLLLLGGIFVIGSSMPALGLMLFGIGLIALSALVLPPTRERLKNWHPITTSGPTENVEERAVGGTDQLCSVCRDTVDSGVIREFKKEYVLAGIPLYTMEAGENWYCDSCHSTHHTLETGHGGFENEFGARKREQNTGDSVGEHNSIEDEFE